MEYIHVKDSRRDTKEIVLAGSGDGHLRDIINKLRNKESMFLSLEPHLAFAGQYKGFTGPNLFRMDLDALKTILSELDVEYTYVCAKFKVMLIKWLIYSNVCAKFEVMFVKWLISPKFLCIN